MLYHPFKDANHCTYRILCILLNAKDVLSVNHLRVVDFYYLFPHFLTNINPWPADISELKKFTKDIPEPYEHTPNRNKLFYELEILQNQSIMQLASKGIVSVEKLGERKVVLNKEKVPAELILLINNDDFIKSDTFKVLINGIAKTKWFGPSGLKKRSGLMEYKYDE